MIEPTERSIPAVRITKNIPRLIIPIPEICRNKLKIFLEVKKTSDTSEEMMRRIIKIRDVLYRRKRIYNDLFELCGLFDTSVAS
jgi:hypothetical protein